MCRRTSETNSVPRREILAAASAWCAGGGRSRSRTCCDRVRTLRRRGGPLLGVPSVRRAAKHRPDAESQARLIRNVRRGTILFMTQRRTLCVRRARRLTHGQRKSVIGRRLYAVVGQGHINASRTTAITKKEAHNPNSRARSLAESERKYRKYDCCMLARNQGLNPSTLISENQTAACATRKLTPRAPNKLLHVKAVLTAQTVQRRGSPMPRRWFWIRNWGAIAAFGAGGLLDRCLTVSYLSSF